MRDLQTVRSYHQDSVSKGSFDVEKVNLRLTGYDIIGQARVR